jgi:N-acetylglucosaminyldiphosphoundecaprenol N-acetyl-beta-D-mannosaminyltransferase
MSRQKRYLLGVGINPVTVSDIHDEIDRVIRSGGHELVLNVNAHCMNLAYERPALRHFLNTARITFCDGAGVLFAARLAGIHLPDRITYADWMWKLAEHTAVMGHSMFFLGGQPGIAALASERLCAAVPGLKIVGVHHGHFPKEKGGPENLKVIDEINRSRANIVVIGFGMPLQEEWLRENWADLNCNIALTGGAVFDYVSGTLRRGPRIMTNNGFEWLARLIIEPRRLWTRYLIGNPRFLLRVVKELLIDKIRHRTED